MTFEQIEYFIAVVESDTFFDAAESLHTTQSNVSKQIKKLEKELDITLFDRSKRLAILTEAGETFFLDAQKLYHLYKQTLDNIQKYQIEAANTLRVGTLPILTQYSLTSIIKKFIEQHPQINLSLTEAEEPELETGLKQGEFDLIIARNFMANNQYHNFYPIAADRLAAILPINHDLSGKTSISIKKIAKESFLLMRPFTSVYKVCAEQFKKFNISPTILRTARMESLISAVAVGEGISLLPEKNFNLFRHDDTIAVPLNPEVPLTVGCIQNKNTNSHASSKFINFLQH